MELMQARKPMRHVGSLTVTQNDVRSVALHQLCNVPAQVNFSCVRPLSQ